MVGHFFVNQSNGGSGEDGELAFGIEGHVVAIVEQQGNLLDFGLGGDDAGSRSGGTSPIGDAGRNAELVVIGDDRASSDAGAKLVAVAVIAGVAGIGVVRFGANEGRAEVGGEGRSGADEGEDRGDRALEFQGAF